MNRTRLRLALIAFALLLAAGASMVALSNPPDAVLADGGHYYGPLIDGRLHGEGRLEWDNGAVYSGGFRDGLMSGEGRLETAGGSVYEGEFEQGLMHGEARVASPAGDIWEGRFERDLIVEGTYRDAEGNLYEGEFGNWAYHGQGRLETVYGEVMEGRFENGWHVEGTYIRADGATYEGVFTDGMLEGEGRYTDTGGNVYTGEFSHDMPHGHGRMTYADGRVYEGEFEFGARHGEGALTPADGGETVTGTWIYDTLDGNDAPAERGLGVETVLYNQPELLAAALDGIEPGDPGIIDLYLLAVGGDGSQEVFRREVAFTVDLFDGRFGTRGRSVSLVNSRNTLETLPLATRTSLKRTLEVLSGRMDDEDILFVYMTSHGSADHQFVLDQNDMALPDLTASELGAMLSDSGIGWKVVVISACYAGGFIEPLGDDTTLVITAAAADRQSFGCSDEADFTYFGRAYLQDALAGTDDFRAAFDAAVEHVRERESEEGMSSHSQPQIHAPETVLSHLAEWRKQEHAARDMAADQVTGP